MSQCACHPDGRVGGVGGVVDVCVKFIVVVVSVVVTFFGINKGVAKFFLKKLN